MNVDHPPVPPASDGAVESDAWQRRARKFAEYFLILLKPWSAVDGTHPGSLTWETFVDFVDQLRHGINGTGPSFVDCTRLHWLQNMAGGLRIPAADRTAVQQFRSRDATRWAAQNTEPHLDPLPTQRPNLRPDIDDTSAQEGIDFLRNLAHIDDKQTRTTMQENLYTETTLANHPTIVGNNRPAIAHCVPPSFLGFKTPSRKQSLERYYGTLFRRRYGSSIIIRLIKQQ